MEGFVRQRRNLILISIGIIIFVLAGADIEKTSILGSTFTIQHKEVILWFGVIAYFYSFWRFYVYLPIEYKSELRNDFLKSLASSMAYKKFASKMRPIDDEELSKIPFLEYKEGLWRLDYTKTLQAAGHHRFGGNLQPSEDNTASVRTDEILWVLASVRIYQTIHHKSVSDYVIPVIIFLIALLFLLYRWLA